MWCVSCDTINSRRTITSQPAFLCLTQFLRIPQFRILETRAILFTKCYFFSYHIPAAVVNFCFNYYLFEKQRHREARRNRERAIFHCFCRIASRELDWKWQQVVLKLAHIWNASAADSSSTCYSALDSTQQCLYIK